MSIDLQLALIVTTAAVAGSLVGGALTSRVPAQTLRKVFAGFVLVMAGYVMWREVGPAPAASALIVASSIMGWWRWRSVQGPQSRPRVLESPLG